MANVTKFFAAIIIVLFSTIYANAETPKSPPTQMHTTELERLIPVHEKAPRTPPTALMCYYSNEYIEIDIPTDVISLHVEIWKDESLVWEGTLTPQCKSIVLNDIIGSAKIVCTSNFGEMFLGFIELS